MTQYAVAFFANGMDQTMDDAVGPFRSWDAAQKAVDALDEALHEGACPQVVRLRTLAEALKLFGEEPSS